MIEKSNLVCPWLPSTLVSDDGGRVMAFAGCYGKQCPYWGIVDMVRGSDGKSQSVLGCRRVSEVFHNE